MKCIQYGNTYHHDSNNIDFTLKKLVILLIKHYEVLFSCDIMHNRLYDVGAVITDLLDRSQMFCIPNLRKKRCAYSSSKPVCSSPPYMATCALCLCSTMSGP
jgi:hypothetical protein